MRRVGPHGRCGNFRSTLKWLGLLGLMAASRLLSDLSAKVLNKSHERAFEQLLRAKSFEQVIEIQSQYAKKAYDPHIAELSKLGEIYAGLTRNAYKPVEQAAAKAGSPNRLRSA
jgi:hypothetical protein